jgi:3',5'-cyclic AMP phosphodiesterase CpdA
MRRRERKMTLRQLNDALKSIDGFSTKVAYRAWPVGKAPKLPFICYLATSTDNFDADNSVYHVLQSVDVELYTAKKSVEAEELIEAKFAECGLVWDKYEEWLDSENCYEIIYTITL